MKLVFLLKYEFEYREKMFSLEFSDYQDSDAREKNNDYFGYLSSNAVFSIEILLEESEPVVAEN